MLSNILADFLCHILESYKFYDISWIKKKINQRGRLVGFRVKIIIVITKV